MVNGNQLSAFASGVVNVHDRRRITIMQPQRSWEVIVRRMSHVIVYQDFGINLGRTRTSKFDQAFKSVIALSLALSPANDT
jgi:hypothetical protein